jgi:hypothetical protein
LIWRYREASTFVIYLPVESVEIHAKNEVIIKTAEI